MIAEMKNVTKRGDIAFKCLKNRHRIIVSKHFGESLVRKVHEFYGHIGAHHLAEKLRPLYYFQNMDSMIDTFCKKCEICIKNKSRRCRLLGKMSKLGPATKPFEIMSVDTVGGFSGNRSPKKYMHILVDHFTRKAFISTTKTQTTRDFIKLIDRVTRNENVHTILADQYSALNSKDLKMYLRDRGVKLVLTSVNNPESNGLNERLNQTLVNRIRCKINSDTRRPWSVIAEECVDEYNRTDHSVTKFSPDYLMYGRRTHIVPQELIEDRDLAHDRKEAFNKSQENFMKNKERIDRNRKEQDIKPNDFVFVETGSKLNRNKLAEIRLGPFRVLNKLSNTMFEIDSGKRKKESNIFHVSKLVPVHCPPGGKM